MPDVSAPSIWFRSGMWVFFALSVAIALMAAVVCVRWVVNGVRTLREAGRDQSGHTDRPSERS